MHLPDGTRRDIPHTSALAGTVRPTAPGRELPARELPGVPASATSAAAVAPATPVAPVAQIPLGRLCGARSGDKGGNANVGLWATSPAAYDWLRQHLTTGRFKELLTEAAGLHVDRYELPNLLALNFVVHGLLAPGVSGTARPDAQAKGLGEYLRSRLITVPAGLISR